MPRIVAIETDARQAARIAALAPAHLDAEIAVVPSVDAALEAIHARVPDLVLTPLLLTPRDDAALNARLRELDAAGITLQSLVTPVLADAVTPDDEPPAAGLFTLMRRARTTPRVPSGCDPAVFAQQIGDYLARAAAERDEREDHAWPPSEPPALAVSAPMLGELMPVLTTAPAVASDTVWAEFEEAAVSDGVEPEPKPIEEPSISEDAEDGGDEFEITDPNAISPVASGDLWMSIDAWPVAVMPAIEGPPVSLRPRPLMKMPKAPRHDGIPAQPRSEIPRRPKVRRPLQDEWGLFDPEQCGFAALLNRLDEITEPKAAAPDRPQPSAIMRR
jgi:hypothetical protein